MTFGGASPDPAESKQSVWDSVLAECLTSPVAGSEDANAVLLGYPGCGLSGLVTRLCGSSFDHHPAFGIDHGVLQLPAATTDDDPTTIGVTSIDCRDADVLLSTALPPSLIPHSCVILLVDASRPSEIMPNAMHWLKAVDTYLAGVPTPLSDGSAPPDIPRYSSPGEGTEDGRSTMWPLSPTRTVPVILALTKDDALDKLATGDDDALNTTGPTARTTLRASPDEAVAVLVGYLRRFAAQNALTLVGVSLERPNGLDALLGCIGTLTGASPVARRLLPAAISVHHEALYVPEGAENVSSVDSSLAGMSLWSPESTAFADLFGPEGDMVQPAPVENFNLYGALESAESKRAKSAAKGREASVVSGATSGVAATGSTRRGSSSAHPGSAWRTACPCLPLCSLAASPRCSARV